MENCIFCKIASGEIPAKKIYEDAHCLAFLDINPKAKTHILIIPRRHVASLMEIDALSKEEVYAILLATKKLAEEYHLQEGFRLVSNCGVHACQSVGHLHFHVLGGEQLSEGMV